MVPFREPDDVAHDDREQVSVPAILPFPSANQVVSQSRPSGNRLTFQSRPMTALIAQASKFARSGAAVLITGESGTGKELLSRLIHQQSNRRNQRYVAVNCAAMPELLAESEFFGHERVRLPEPFNNGWATFNRRTRGQFYSTRSAKFRRRFKRNSCESSRNRKSSESGAAIARKSTYELSLLPTGI